MKILAFDPSIIIGTITPPDNVPSTQGQFEAIIGAIIRLIVAFGFLAALILLMIGGISWILSGGDEKAVAKAKGRVTAALIGLILVLSVIAIFQLLSHFFGINLLVIKIPTP
jgi:hypothetical protein